MSTGDLRQADNAGETGSAGKAGCSAQANRAGERAATRTATQAMLRARNGRWLGGVCAGLAPRRGVKTGWMRFGFVASALLFGLGVVAYCSLWLILPFEGEDRHSDRAHSGIVVVAQGLAVCAGLAVLALFGAAATLFGFGWAVVALGAAALLVAALAWERSGPAWALLPVMALGLSSVAVAAAGLRLAPQTGRTVIKPSTTFTGGTYSSGLGTLLIDLRHSTLPSGSVPIRVQAGLRRTIIALPHDRCVRVGVRYHVNPYLRELASAVSGNGSSPLSELVLFGTVQRGTTAIAGNLTSGSADPVLNIDFSSMGGSLYVRDYPDGVNPEIKPDWPGYRVNPEHQRPDTSGMTRNGADSLIRNWKARLARELRSRQLINALMAGPCGTGGSIR